MKYYRIREINHGYYLSKSMPLYYFNKYKEMAVLFTSDNVHKALKILRSKDCQVTFEEV